jgi:hypothetical protein
MCKQLLNLLIFLCTCCTAYGQGNGTLSPKSIAVTVPEVQELVYIIFALTDAGRSDSILIDHESDYYRQVMAYFDSYKEAPIVQRINRELAKQHYPIQMDACNYSFGSNNQLIKHPEYHNLSWGKKDHLKKYASDLEAFSRETNFRDFYREHEPYYAKLIALMEQQAAIDASITWLEARFPVKYQHIQIHFSPLSYGKHTTNYTLPDLTIWVSKPIEHPTQSEVQTELAVTRMLFTEFDHNYVNPVSDSYAHDIKRAFKKRDGWVDDAKAAWYKQPYDVFNEYMTWSVYLLFVYDHYPLSDYLLAKNTIEQVMTHNRGFIRFTAFYNHLLELYTQGNKEMMLSALYPEILTWCAQQ